MDRSATKTLSPDAGGIQKGAGILSEGGLLAFPTETVYGLGADARNDTAVAGIFKAKGRPSFNPLIVHVASLDAARAIGRFSQEAIDLATRAWPGPLTLVLQLDQDAGLSPLVTAGKDSIAVRVPDHPVAIQLLAAFGGPIAAPSANPSGKISPTDAHHVLQGLGGQIDGVIDAGPCPSGVESTIIDTRGAPAVLRHGGFTAHDLPFREASDEPDAPGQLASHYAPSGAVRLNANSKQSHETHIGFGPIAGDISLSETGDLHEAAARLFRLLHDMNARGVTHIAVAPIPNYGLGLAINDRLERAAAPRE